MWVCSHVFVFLCVWVGIYVHAHVCGNQRSNSGVVPREVPPWFFSWSLNGTWSLLIIPGQLANERQGCRVCFLSDGIITTRDHTQLSYLGAGGWTLVLMLAQQVLYRLSHPPSPQGPMFFPCWVWIPIDCYVAQESVEQVKVFGQEDVINLGFQSAAPGPYSNSKASPGDLWRSPISTASPRSTEQKLLEEGGSCWEDPRA